jgi:hypothetical protein
MARGFEITTGLVIQQGIFEANTVAQHRIGTRMQLADGRVFYYAEAGGALTCGKMALSVLPTTDFDICAVSTGAANAKALTITPAGSPSVAANDFAEGYLVIHTGTTGAGQIAKIKSHDASASNSVISLVLYDPLVLVVNADCTAEIIRNPWKDVTHLADNTGTPVGVPLVAIASASFGWLQTWGVCALLAGGAGSITDKLVVATTGGEVTSLSIATEGAYTGTPVEVGHNLSVTMTDTYYHATYLTLYP